MLAYIVFEKLTGLSGTISGWWKGDIDKINPELPMIYESFIPMINTYVFRQDGQYIYLQPTDPISFSNYLNHFQHGVNFLIKEWSYGRGERININQSPN